MRKDSLSLVSSKPNQTKTYSLLEASESKENKILACRPWPWDSGSLKCLLWTPVHCLKHIMFIKTDSTKAHLCPRERGTISVMSVVIIPGFKAAVGEAKPSLWSLLCVPDFSVS